MGGDQQRRRKDGASLPALAEITLQLQEAGLDRERHQDQGMVGQAGEQLFDEYPATRPMRSGTQGEMSL
jgi:hypothetical protein